MIENPVVYQSEIVNGNKRVLVIISARGEITCTCSISCGILKKVYRYKNRQSVFIRVNQWLTKVFSHRLTQITLISSIYSFPCSLILPVMINYRRLGHYRILGSDLLNSRSLPDFLGGIVFYPHNPRQDIPNQVQFYIPQKPV